MVPVVVPQRCMHTLALYIWDLTFAWNMLTIEKLSNEIQVKTQHEQLMITLLCDPLEDLVSIDITQSILPIH